MGKRAGRKKATRRQKMANMKPLPEVVSRVTPPEQPKLVAAGVRRKGQASVTQVDFNHFKGREKDGPVPPLDQMSDLGRGVVIALASRMRLTPEEIIRRVSQ